MPVEQVLRCIRASIMVATVRQYRAQYLEIHTACYNILPRPGTLVQQMTVLMHGRGEGAFMSKAPAPPHSVLSLE